MTEVMMTTEGVGVSPPGTEGVWMTKDVMSWVSGSLDGAVITEAGG